MKDNLDPLIDQIILTDDRSLVMIYMLQIMYPSIELSYPRLTLPLEMDGGHLEMTLRQID